MLKHWKFKVLGSVCLFVCFYPNPQHLETMRGWEEGNTMLQRNEEPKSQAMSPEARSVDYLAFLQQTFASPGKRKDAAEVR